MHRESRIVSMDTGGAATLRSLTLIPALLSPATTARFTIRAALLVSRLTTTWEPAWMVDPYASASRRPSSGVMSTLTSPQTPMLENSESPALLSQMSEEVTTAPGLIRLKG